MQDQNSLIDPERLQRMADDGELQTLARTFFNRTCEYRYSYHFTWMGRPIIQYPADLVAMQEIIWRVQPDAIVETGIAHGGSLIFYASLLELIGGDRKVIGVDIEIRPHNRAAIEKHPMAHRIHMVEGSSVDPAVVKNVRELVAGKPKVIVALDSNHTRDHVLEELRAYEGLVRKGSYLVVFDTVIEDMPQHAFPQRTWGPGNNPKTAVHEFLRTNSRFVIDKEMNSKLLTTVCPDGYLRCVAD